MRPATEAAATPQWTPPVDIGENDAEFVLKAELPAVKKENIEVNVDHGTLFIRGERNLENEEEGLKLHRLERVYGRFERSFSLPTEADPDEITSEFNNGVLTVHLPKNPGAKSAAHLIPVS